MNLGAFIFFLVLISGISGYYYDDYDYNIFLSIYGRLLLNCVLECNCFESYLIVMYCDELKLKSVLMVFFGIKYFYFRNN